MRKSLIKLLFISVITFPFLVRAQGIRFNSSDSSIINRTSYNVFVQNQPRFEGDFNVEFDMSILDPNIFGYIFHIIDKNTSTSYSLAYIGKIGNLGEIKLNRDGVKTLVTVPLKNELLGERKWIKISLNFNPTVKKITLGINDKVFSFNENEFSNSIIPEIYFGKHGSVIDVPSMSIKKLNIKNKNNKYIFNFNESEGNDVFDSTDNLYGNVNHPNWLIKESYHWKLRHTTAFKKVTSVTFDENNSRFIFQNADTLNFYDFKTEKNTFHSFKNEMPVSMRLGTSFLNSAENKLYVYELYDVLPEKPTIASINLNDPKYYWQTNSLLKRSPESHHHNAFLDSKNNQLVIFGGYGHMRFTNDFNAYNFENNTWKQLTFTGDIISPRFFSGLAKLTKHEILIFGGQGNRTGEQSIGKTYYYDCHKVNLLTKKIEKLWEIEQENINMVSARNIVITKDSSSFYALRYPEYIPSTSLQLYKYSIKDGSHQVLGDYIPMNSEEILTNANLYINKSTNQLFCTTQEFKDDGSSKINIYSLNAPPVSKEDIYSPKGKSNSNIVIILVILLVIVSLLLFIHFIIKKRKRKKDAIQVQVQKVLKRDQDTNKEITITNSVILFGSFKVINRYEKDISYLFSPKVRQLFLLLLFSSNQKNMIGVTSELIYTTIWPDSTSKKATNLKNVMISQLRNILKDIDGLELIYSNGRFFIEFEEAFYCDYFSFLTQLEAIRNDLFDENSLTQLTKIISPGKFLQSINDECFDKVKKDFEYEVLKRIPNQIKLLYTNKDYAPIIPLTEVLFNIDSLNETAFYYRIHTLLKMKMTFKAKKQFNYFIINYNKIMGDNFPYTYKDVMRQIPDNLE